MQTETHRFSRQEELIPPAKLAAVRATVIGVGAIGRQVALQLAAIGVPQLRLVDFDGVEESNITTQGYVRDQLGQAKVLATAADIARIDPKINVEVIQDRYRPRMVLTGEVFCCVDSIETRAVIWRSAREECGFWTDGRMLGEVIRVLTANNVSSREYYASTLFAAAEAQLGRCTSHSTIYAAALAASLMVHQLARELRGLPTDRDLSFNLLASEISTH